MKITLKTILAVVAMPLLHGVASACPSCYGAADAPIIDAANTAVLAMLGITGSVISGIAIFFVAVVRRAGKYPDEGTAGESTDTRAEG